MLLVILASKAEEEPRTSRKATARLRGGFPKRAGTSDSGTHILNTVIMNWKSTLVNQIACLRVEHLHQPDLPQAREAGSLSDKLVCHNSGPIGTKYDTGVPNRLCGSHTKSHYQPLHTIPRSRSLIQEEVSKLLLKQAILITVHPSKRDFYSNIFLVPKKDEGQRPVINLKALNSFVHPEYFKMAGIHTLKEMLR